MRRCDALDDAGFEPLQAAISLMVTEVGAVERNDQARETCCGQAVNRAEQKPSVRDNAARYARGSGQRDEPDDFRWTSGSPP
jgi:hypothetical protein